MTRHSKSSLDEPGGGVRPRVRSADTTMQRRTEGERSMTRDPIASGDGIWEDDGKRRREELKWIRDLWSHYPRR